MLFPPHRFPEVRDLQDPFANPNSARHAHGASALPRRAPSPRRRRNRPEPILLDTLDTQQESQTSRARRYANPLDDSDPESFPDEVAFHILPEHDGGIFDEPPDDEDALAQALLDSEDWL